MSTGYPTGGKAGKLEPGKNPEPGNSAISDIDGDENLRDEIAMSSAEAKLYAAADATRAGLHIKMIAEELEITVPQVVQIGVDAQAALASQFFLLPTRFTKARQHQRYPSLPILMAAWHVSRY